MGFTFAWELACASPIPAAQATWVAIRHASSVSPALSFFLAALSSLLMGWEAEPVLLSIKRHSPPACFAAESVLVAESILAVASQVSA